MSRAATLLRRASDALLVAALVCSPSQWSFAVAAAHLTPADLLLALAAVLRLAAVAAGRGCMPHPPPWPYLLFCFLAAAAAWRAPSPAAAAKDLLQTWLYFGAAPLLVADALRRGGPRLLARAAAVALALGVAVLGAAAWQYLRGAPGDPLAVRGTFGNRNVLGGFLALLLPAAFGVALHARGWRLRAALLAVVAAGLLLTLSGAAWLAVAAALCALAALRGAVALAATCAALVAIQTAVLPALPRQNDRELLASTALYDDAGQPTRRYPEWQPAALMILDHPWRGVGLGRYQREVGRYYGTIPNATGPSEPDIQNLYLVLAGEGGLPYAAVFGVLLLTGAAAAGAATRAAGVTGWRLGLGQGLAAAIAAFALTAVWHPLLVRGIGLPLAAVLTACRFLAPGRPPPDAAAPPQPEPA